MVHNGIEYGLMAAYAEGLNVIANADMGKRQREMDAETAPLERPELYQYEIDTTEVAEVWRRGSVVGSWLLDLTAAGAARVADARGVRRAASPTRARGAGRRSRRSRKACPTPVLTTALYSRFASRDMDDFANRLLSAMRKQFGGHDEKKARPMALEIEVLADAQAVAERGAEIVAAAAAAAVAERGRFTFAVSGGRTPWAMFAEPLRAHAVGEGHDLPGRRAHRARRRS